VNYYNALANSNAYSNIVTKVSALLASNYATIAKPTAINTINKMFELIAVNELPERRKTATKSLRFAEAELRIMSAMIQENSVREIDYHELCNLFTNCNLNVVYMCNNKDLITKSNIGFYYSTVNLMARSDAFLYFPGYDGADTSQIINGDMPISLNKTFEKSQSNRRLKSQTEIELVHNSVKNQY